MMVRSKSAFGKFVDAAHDRDAGIVDEDVDRPEVARDLFDHLCDGGGLRHVGGDCYGAAAIGLDLGDDGFGVIRPLAIIDRDRGTEFGQRHRDRRTNAARAACHQRDTRAQILFVSSIPSVESSVMAGHSRLKDGVASARLCPAIHVLLTSNEARRGCPAQGRA